MPGCSSPPVTHASCRNRAESVAERLGGRSARRPAERGRAASESSSPPLRPDDLQGHAPVQLGVEGEVHHAHAAPAELREVDVAVPPERVAAACGCPPARGSRESGRVEHRQFEVDRPVEPAPAPRRPAAGRRPLPPRVSRPPPRGGRHPPPRGPRQRGAPRGRSPPPPASPSTAATRTRCPAPARSRGRGPDRRGEVRGRARSGSRGDLLSFGVPLILRTGPARQVLSQAGE